ncbi:MAG: hypothetical protein K2Y27_25495 [Xanthobacteraceae bacterium]|nr:hypothetical protein [Xanthobacteraceae bacterium]
MQRFFALLSIVTALTLTLGMGKVIWWPDPAVGNHAEAHIPDGEEETISPRENLIRGIIWVRATLPLDVNDHTKLVAVGLAGKIYWSRFVMDLDAGEVSDKTRRALHHDAVEDVCKRLRKALHANVISAYQADYVDRRRNPIETVEVTKGDCR